MYFQIIETPIIIKQINIIINIMNTVINAIPKIVEEAFSRIKFNYRIKIKIKINYLPGNRL